MDEIFCPYHSSPLRIQRKLAGHLCLCHHSVVFISFYGGFQIGYQDTSDLFLSGTIAVILSNSLDYLQASLVGRALLALSPFLLMTLTQIFIVFLWSHLVNYWFNRIFPPYHMLLIYGGKEVARDLTSKMVKRANKYIIQEAISVEESDDQIKERIDQYDIIILCDVPSSKRNDLLKYCFGNGNRIYTTPKISDILIRGALNSDLFDTPLLLNTDEVLTPEQKTIKRAVDLIFSALSLLLFSPFMLIIAIAIKIYDLGPVFYKQERLNGKRFDVYKFHSMIVGAEKENGAQLSTENDHRITPVGRVIRAIRFDELPQLWNILKGDMSIVEPRPERPEFVESYARCIPEFEYRLKVKAGLTGYAQIYSKYNTTPYDKLKMDLIYISNYHLLLDLKIMMLTLKIIFKKDSGQGVKPEEP